MYLPLQVDVPLIQPPYFQCKHEAGIQRGEKCERRCSKNDLNAYPSYLIPVSLIWIKLKLFKSTVIPAM